MTRDTTIAVICVNPGVRCGEHKNIMPTASSTIVRVSGLAEGGGARLSLIMLQRLTRWGVRRKEKGVEEPRLHNYGGDPRATKEDITDRPYGCGILCQDVCVDMGLCIWSRIYCTLVIFCEEYAS
eukprot:COSAG01_NODE_17_length_39991_cov_30.596160_2_plen_125_part_00